MSWNQPGGHQPRQETGQGMVEFALLLPVLLLLAIGLINFTFIFQAYIQVVNAADVGAAWAATSEVAAADDAGISATALKESDRWHCRDTQVSSTRVGDPQGFGRVSVTVSCDVQDLIAIPANFNQVVVSATATRRIRP